MSEQTSAIRTGKPGSRNEVHRLVTMAMLCAVGVVLMALVEVPLLPTAPFLKYDPAGIPILIGALLYGPWAGLVMTFVVSFIQSFMIHGSSGVVGFFMHMVASGFMVIAVGLYYRNSSGTLSSAAIALLLGSLAMTAGMIGMNLLVTPIFLDVPLERVVKMLVPTIIPFNLIKAALNSVLAFLVLRPLEKLLRRGGA